MRYYFLGGIAVLLIVLILVISSRPAEFKISRSVMVAATPIQVFEEVNDFHKWQAWSPWAKLDPKALQHYHGPLSGEGAVFSWSGNNKLGVGSTKIIKSEPGQKIVIDLEMIKPFKASNNVEFTFKPEGNNTVVTWTMTGTNNFVSKAVSLFMNCDAMVGKQFEEGLANIKKIVEKQY